MALVSGAELRQREKEDKAFREKLEQEKEKLLQMEIEKMQREKEIKRMQQCIKNCGIMDAYDKLIDDLMRNGRPENQNNGDIFEYAAYFITKINNKK